MNEKEFYIKEEFEKVGISLTEEQCLQFFTYYEMLVETNQVMNLTAITEFKEVVAKHFIDSCLIGKYYDMSQAETMADVGTGAGFPGLPLKILYPHLKTTLLDSLNKRVDFLKKVVDNLGLSDVTCVHGRAEDLGRNKDFREMYDLCVSRAVANLSTLSEYCTPFVRVGGFFISYKSGNVDEELSQAKGAIKLLGCKTRKVEKFELSFGEEDTQGRSLVIIERIEKLSSKYPRKAGMPSKTPLK